MSGKKDRTSIIFPVLIIAIFAMIIAAFFYSFFTIERWTQREAFSAEAKKNIYLAFDRWLETTGHPLTLFKYGSADDIKEAGIKNNIIFASSYDWSSFKELEELIMDDKYNVVLFIDTDDDNEMLEYFLLDFDIEYRLYSPWEDSAFDDDYDEDNFSLSDEIYFRIKGSDKQTKIYSIGFNENSLIVCGAPLFMRSNHLQEKDNARLAWSVSGALDKYSDGFTITRSDEAASGIIYSSTDSGNVGELFMENKASLIIILSSLALLIAGFSQSVLSFGKWEPERVLPGKSIKERLLSEARFLKKHHALTLYAKEYEREIRGYFKHLNIESDEDIINIIEHKYGVTREDARSLLSEDAARSPVSVKDLLKYKKIAAQVTGSND